MSDSRASHCSRDLAMICSAVCVVACAWIHWLIGSTLPSSSQDEGLLYSAGHGGVGRSVPLNAACRLASVFHCQPLRWATISLGDHSPIIPGSSIRPTPIARNVSSHHM